MSVARSKPPAPSADKRWKIVETRMRRLGNRPDALIEALHSAQEAFGFIDDDALRYVGETLSVPPSKVFGVATFYHYFTLKPQGEHTCVVCTGTACYINGAAEILGAIRRCLTDEAFIQKCRTVENPYGTGDAGKKIADVLARVALDQKLITKQMTIP